MNKEVHYEGWLIKSPPTKRIWRARWRRRWFTLKQGEIPEQFCLEYYTDRNCRKLKGVIDLDQCEQVDCGLRLENRKQKFQFMFDIKTPKRTYYLAADTEADMRDWVNCICQVCHLLDTKQSNGILNESNRIPNTTSSMSLSNSMTSAKTPSVHSSTTGVYTGSSGSVSLPSDIPARGASNSNDIQLRRSVILEQPHSFNVSNLNNNINNINPDCPYVNTEYSSRDTLICDMHLDQRELPAAAPSATKSTSAQLSSSPGGGAIYLNSPLFGAKQRQERQSDSMALRLAVSSNGIVRKIPENLVLNNVTLAEQQEQQQQQQQQQHQQQTALQTENQQQQQQNSVQASPALSTVSGPYIPISECFSGSPKFTVDSNNPKTPLNNLDPKFYDTPRSHNNIGLNLTNDTSYSPKITNCSLQQIPSSLPSKNRSHRSDSDSESVFTDDEEWSHPMPLRDNVDRSLRPSDSSVENEPFVWTYLQRFSKVPDSAYKEQQQQSKVLPLATNATATATSDLAKDNSAKILKNKNNLILDFKENEKTPRDLPQFSDTENTSPAIGPRDSTSVVEESYDIPRSHNFPYFNMGHLFEAGGVTSPETNPMAASTPNLVTGNNAVETTATSSPANVKTLPRPHCYTNAAPTKVEGNVFRYDFIEQADLPPVNRKLKPKSSLEDKPPEESPIKPPTAAATRRYVIYDNLASKLMSNLTMQSPRATNSPTVADSPLPKPPSVDRKLKPNFYKIGRYMTVSVSPSLRRSSGAPLSMILPNDNDSYVLETRTLPRQPRSNLLQETVSNDALVNPQSTYSNQLQQQMLQKSPIQLQTPPKNEHKLQYFDLDVTNPPQRNRQSVSVGNLNTSAGSNRKGGLPADPSARAPAKSGIVYNSVDFVKTEAFKRIREERKKESEGSSGACAGAVGNASANSATNNNK